MITSQTIKLEVIGNYRKVERIYRITIKSQPGLQTK